MLCNPIPFMIFRLEIVENSVNNFLNFWRLNFSTQISKLCLSTNPFFLVSQWSFQNCEHFLMKYSKIFFQKNMMGVVIFSILCKKFQSNFQREAEIFITKVTPFWVMWCNIKMKPHIKMRRISRNHSLQLWNLQRAHLV